MWIFCQISSATHSFFITDFIFERDIFDGWAWCELLYQKFHVYFRKICIFLHYLFCISTQTHIFEQHEIRLHASEETVLLHRLLRNMKLGSMGIYIYIAQTKRHFEEFIQHTGIHVHSVCNILPYSTYFVTHHMYHFLWY